VKPDGCSTVVAFFCDCNKITEMTKFQAAVHAAPALAYSAAVIFSDFGVVEIRSIFADSLAMCGVAGRDWIKAPVERI
jgi:hypothetical protein